MFSWSPASFLYQAIAAIFDFHRAGAWMIRQLI
jgi:hypothetical protein